MLSFFRAWDARHRTLDTHIACIIFAALVAASVFGAVARAGSATYSCDTPAGRVTVPSRDATRTPEGWVVRVGGRVLTGVCVEAAAKENGE